MDANDRLVAQREAAGFLGVSPNTLNFWRTKGRGPKYVAISNRCVRYRVSDLTAWVNARTITGPEARRLEGLVR